MAKVLGKGLEAIIPGWKQKQKDEIKQDLSARIDYIGIDSIKANSFQPRKDFNSNSLRELADSISKNGIIQPIVVVKKDSFYGIIAGERRYRAAKLAGIKEVPVVIREVQDDQSFELALIENIQREDLNAIEEAEAYEYLMNHYNLNQEKLAQRVNKNRSTIANALRLLALPERIRDAIRNKEITSAQARTLLGIQDNATRLKLLERIKTTGMSVRELEEISRAKKKNTREQRDPDLDQLEQDLIRKFAVKVQITTKGKDKKTKGNIKFSFSSLEDLNNLAKKFEV